MSPLHFLFAVVILFASNVSCHKRPAFANIYPEVKQSVLTAAVVDDALFLTPYIESGDTAEALELASVDPTALGLDEGSLTSYAGYLTVNDDYNSNLYFWFFPASEVESPTTAPVILWLSGLSTSSLFGLFVENGPYEIDANMELVSRDYAWNRNYSVLYIDNPVGTGFSFTDSKQGYARNEDDVANDMYEALTQFFELFSDYRSSDFYIMGESYAGKYIPAIADKIRSSTRLRNRIELKGIAMANGYTDPLNMRNYADFMYNIGLADDQDRDYLHRQQELFEQYCLAGDYIKANDVREDILNYINTCTGFDYNGNYLQTTRPVGQERYQEFVQLSNVRDAIHVGNQTFSSGFHTHVYLLEDLEKSVKSTVETLLRRGTYDILYYNGEMDLLVTHTQTEDFLGQLLWSRRQEFITASRSTMTVDTNEPSGYRKTVGALTYAIIRNAGHFASYDQPQYVYELIEDFISGTD